MTSIKASSHVEVLPPWREPTAIEKLDQVIGFLGDEKNWTWQKERVEREDGGFSCCLVGAIRHFDGEAVLIHPVHAAIRREVGWALPGANALVAYNDNPRNSHRDIMRVLGNARAYMATGELPGRTLRHSISAHARVLWHNISNRLPRPYAWLTMED